MAFPEVDMVVQARDDKEEVSGQKYFAIRLNISATPAYVQLTIGRKYRIVVVPMEPAECAAFDRLEFGREFSRGA